MKKIFSLTLILLVMTIAYFVVFSWFSDNISDAISSSVIFITLLVLYWYTLETRNIHLITKKQLEINNKPILAIELEDKSDGFYLIINNIGNGPAFNIDIPDIILSDKFAIHFKFESISFLRPRDRKPIKVRNYSGGRESDFPFYAHLKSEYANTEIKLTLKYNDIEMKEINQIFDLGTGKLKIYVV